MSSEPSPTQIKSEPPLSFEKSLAALEEIVRQLEAGEKPLEESLALYEKGVAAYRRCNDVLDAAKNRIRVVLAGSTGEAILRESDASVPQHKKESKRKEPKEPKEPGVKALSAAVQNSAAPERNDKNDNNSSQQSVDSGPPSVQNPTASVTSRSRSTHGPSVTDTGANAGDSLFGS